MREARSPVAILLNARGDYLLNLPALRALSHLWPEDLRVVCREGARRTFFPELPLADVLEPETDCLGPEYTFDAGALVAELGECDLLLSLNPWHGAALDRLLGGLAPARSVGFHPSFATHLPLDFSKHSAELAFDVPRTVSPSLRIEDFAGPPELLEGSEEFARLLAERVEPDARIVAVHDDTKDDKLWAPERFAATLDELIAAHPTWIVFDVGARDLGLDRGAASDRVVPCGRLPLSVATALVGQADLFIGVDSCFLHAADLYRVPSVALFGPTDAHEFGLRFARHRHVAGDGGMDAITTEMVLAAVDELLAEELVAG